VFAIRMRLVSRVIIERCLQFGSASGGVSQRSKYGVSLRVRRQLSSALPPAYQHDFAVPPFGIVVNTIGWVGDHQLWNRSAE
jgi:hypothetical protein